jgi:threonine dehydrogenase-like Zn-dependent dehydrogenase
MDMSALVLKDASMFGVLNGTGLYERMLEALATGLFRVSPLVDAEYPLRQGAEAIARLVDNDRTRPKVILSIGGP